MNIELLDPFRQTIPDHIEATILHPALTLPCNVLSHNRRGFYLAAGYSCGSVVVWCALSRVLLRFFEGLHEPSPLGPVALAWGKDSRALVTGGDDGKIAVLRLDERPVQAVVVDAMGELEGARGGAKLGTIKYVRLHPNNADVALVVTTCGYAFELALGGGEKRKGKEGSDAKAAAGSPLRVLCGPGGRATGVKAADAAFDKKGGAVFVAVAKAEVNVYDSVTHKKLRTIKVEGKPIINAILFSPRGDRFLLRCQDNKLRIFSSDCKDGRLVTVFQEAVNGTSFDDCVWTNDGEHIIGEVVRRHVYVLT